MYVIETFIQPISSVWNALFGDNLLYAEILQGESNLETLVIWWPLAL